MDLFKCMLYCLVLAGSVQTGYSETTDKPLPPWAQKIVDRADFSFIKTAIVKQDNDINYFDNHSGKKAAIPKAVQEALQTLSKKDFKLWVNFAANEDLDTKPNPVYIPKPQDMYGLVFLIKAPNGTDLYAQYRDIPGSWGGGCYAFTFYDPKTELVSKEPAIVSSRWAGDGVDPSDTPLIKPYVTFVDLDGDGNGELVLQWFHHNGTASNAAIYDYYAIDDKLSFHEVLEIKTRFETHWYAGDVPHFATVIREARPIGSDQVEVESFIELEDKRRIDVGSSMLKRRKPGMPYKVFKKVIKNKDFKRLLDELGLNNNGE